MHIVELSTAVVKGDIKVIDVILTQNQCLQCETNTASEVIRHTRTIQIRLLLLLLFKLLTHVEIPRLRDATELNNDA